MIHLKHSFGRAAKKREDVSVIEEKREQHEPCLKRPRGKQRRNKEPYEEFSDYPQTLFYKCSSRIYFPADMNWINWYSGGWSPVESTWHFGHQYAYWASPGWLWWWRSWWNDDWQGKPKYSEKKPPQFRFVHHKPSMLCSDANPGRRGGKSAANRLSYGTTSCGYESKVCNDFYVEKCHEEWCTPKNV
jgi:hypothetical protein